MQFWESAKSAAVLVVITFLIWFTADRNVRDVISVRIPVRLLSDDPARYAGFAKPPNRVVFDVLVAGRRRELKEFADLIQSREVLDAHVPRSRAASPRPQVINSREILGYVRLIAQSNVSIVEVRPPNEAVIIDDFETVRNVRVKTNFGELQILGEPVPPVVSVKLPGFAAEKLRAVPEALADAEQRILAARRPDGAFSVKVPLSFDALKDFDPDLPVEILPGPEVSITGQIKLTTITARKGPVQITWSVPHQVQHDFRIVVDPATNFRPDIEVTGPKEVVEQLDPRDILAFVEVLAADTEKPNTEIRRRVRFILPDDCTQAPGSAPYEIAFSLEPRAAPSPHGP